MQVNESASSALTQELVKYASSKNQSRVVDNSEDMMESAWLSSRIASAQTLRGQGIIVGLRMAERLLYREPAFGGSPLEIARFVGFTLWRAVFGKKVDSIKAIEKSYFLTDGDFRWLQGFSRAGGSGDITDLSLDVADGKNGGLGDKSVVDEYAGHKDILTYTVGIIEGAIQIVLSGGDVSVKGSFSSEGETQFVLEFHEV